MTNVSVPPPKPHVQSLFNPVYRSRVAQLGRNVILADRALIAATNKVAQDERDVEAARDAKHQAWLLLSEALQADDEQYELFIARLACGLEAEHRGEGPGKLTVGPPPTCQDCGKPSPRPLVAIAGWGWLCGDCIDARTDQAREEEEAT